jgi:hypothetical protein
MIPLRIIAAATLSSLLLSGGATGSVVKQRPERVVNLPAGDNRSGNLKVLAEGFHSAITTPFIAVLRDKDTYGALVKLENGLPTLDEDFFKSRVVIAVFLGQRNTGGYSVEITRDGESGGIRVREKAPAKGVMVPEVITYPFKMVSLEIAGTSPVVIGFNDRLNDPTQSYRLKTGAFTMSGGISGRSENFNLEGTINVIRVGRLATFTFLLKNAGETNEHLLLDCATGIVAGDGAITIHKLSSMTLIQEPNSGLRAEGRFSRHESGLNLQFISLPSMIADGYSGGGNIEALAIASASKP